MRRPDDGPEVVRLVDAAAEAFEAERFEDALAHADEALALAPRSVAALHYRAEALAELGRLDEALAAYERALAEGKDDVEVLLGAADLFVNRLAEEDLLACDPALSPSILGLFRGSPYGRSDGVDPWTHLPSSIVLFQRNLERFARSRADLIEQIGITLIHEVGHFLGLDEDELYVRGLD